MRSVITTLVVLSMAACEVGTSVPEARLDVSARPALLEQIRGDIYEFAEENNFVIFDSDYVQSDDRFWVRFNLQRDDGVMVTVDNLRDERILTIFFFAKSSETEWRQVKEQLETRITGILGNAGELKNVPIDTP